MAEIEALYILLKVCYSGLPGVSGVSAIKSVFCSKDRSSRHHPFRVIFISDADEPDTHCMRQCFISSSSYSEFQTELPTKSYGVWGKVGKKSGKEEENFQTDKSQVCVRQKTADPAE